jgi:hypothetical protein
MIDNIQYNGSTSLYSDGSGYFYDNMYRLFYTKFNQMCSLYTYRNKDANLTMPDINKICRFIEKEFKVEKYLHDTGSANSMMFFFNENDQNFLVRLYKEDNSDYSNFIIMYSGEFPKKLIDTFYSLNISIEKRKKEIGVIVEQNNNLTVYYSPLTRCEFDADNYNDDLVKNHDLIVEELNSEKNGVHLFYGVPGTGKTSYISCLTDLVDKNLIYIPSSIATMIDSPQFLQLLINNTNSVFIIEDAEKIIVSRDENVNSPIAALLNLSDGLLGQTLKSQFICTFNTNLEKVDSALLRRGRLLSSHEFLPLTEIKAKKLAKKLGKDYNEGETTLTDIYNSEIIKNTIINKIRTAIGFKI